MVYLICVVRLHQFHTEAKVLQSTSDESESDNNSTEFDQANVEEKLKG